MSVCLFGYVLLGGAADAAYAHGASIKLTQGEIDITATFETGDPMNEAQVLIYAPTDLENPWATGQTNENGQFSFTPEAEKSGLWEITVRKAGHGHTTTFALDEPTAGGTGALLGASTKEAAPVQQWLSMAAIVWGFVGTALFFARKTPITTTESTRKEKTASGEHS